MLTVYKKKGFVYLSTIFELATTLKNLGVRWLSEKKKSILRPGIQEEYTLRCSGVKD